MLVNDELSETSFVKDMVHYFKYRLECSNLINSSRIFLDNMNLFDFLSWFVIENNYKKIGENVDEEDVVTESDKNNEVYEPSQNASTSKKIRKEFIGNPDWKKGDIQSPFISSETGGVKNIKLFYNNGRTLRMRCKPKNAAFGCNADCVKDKLYSIAMLTVRFRDRKCI